MKVILSADLSGAAASPGPSQPMGMGRRGKPWEKIAELQASVVL